MDLGRAFTLNPQLKSATFFPSVVLKNAEMLFNFGDQPWKFPPPKVGDFFLVFRVHEFLSVVIFSEADQYPNYFE